MEKSETLEHHSDCQLPHTINFYAVIEHSLRNEKLNIHCFVTSGVAYIQLVGALPSIFDFYPTLSQRLSVHRSNTHESYKASKIVGWDEVRTLPETIFFESAT